MTRVLCWGMGVMGVAVLLLAGCATSPPAVQPPVGLELEPPVAISYARDLKAAPEDLWPDNALKTRFQQYWALRFAGLSKAAFAMEAPYFQEMVSMSRYRSYAPKAEGYDRIDIEVRDLVKETEYLLMVHCVISFHNEVGNEGKKRFIRDRWVYAGGRWYHVVKDPIFFPWASLKNADA